ncbi:tetratricopeptide repeat protein [Marimonas arenosa]|uniref:Tetratricopeptide repeat protein n=1 Tax=Marimonas arenosa TaxID=1795305 RepID=A0AAE4B7X8_9RHOB|nr:tetratricopeptide repeat protein [Marimonas arenosa]MDQ2092031.1 tetratricopeptide repeat protein [Marimonas arenosa]
MIRAGFLLSSLLGLVACTAPLAPTRNSPFPPGFDQRAEAVDGLVVGHRLMQAGEYELALGAFTRAAAEHGMTVDVAAALGTANLGLGRLGQAETLLRRAVKQDDAIPETWNNLGVVLMEQRKYTEAEQVFRRAYALDNGQSDSIRDNLRLALAKSENSDYGEYIEQDYKLVRRGSSDYLIRQIP